MHETKELTNRLESLETKTMFQDDLIEQLNQSLINQQSDIQKLTLLVARLNAQLDDIQQPNIANTSQEAPPPHY